MKHRDLQLIDVTEQHEGPFFALEADAVAPYAEFVYDDRQQGRRISRFLYRRRLCEFCPPHGRLLVDDSTVVGMIAASPATVTRDMRMRGALALGKIGFLQRHPQVRARLHLAAAALMPLHADEYYLSRIAVARAHRQTGLGSFLLQSFERAGRTLGHRRFALEVDPSNRAAVSLYERFGYTEVGRRQIVDSHSGRLLEYAHMRKIIDEGGFSATAQPAEVP